MMQSDITIARLETLYREYCTVVDHLEHNRRLRDGFLGLGGGPAEDPCHTRFQVDVAAVLTDFADGEPDSEALREVLSYLYEIPRSMTAPKSAYWMLIAVQGLTAELIARLAPGDAQQLAARYTELYPRRERLPVQDELLKRLKKAAK